MEKPPFIKDNNNIIRICKYYKKTEEYDKMIKFLLLALKEKYIFPFVSFRKTRTSLFILKGKLYRFKKPLCMQFSIVKVG